MQDNYNRFLNSLGSFYEPSGIFAINTGEPVPNTGKPNSPPKNALVLSGGSVKGCFQAGVIQAVLESGFIPDIIYGISVGSLNGAFLVNAAGKRLLEKKAPLTIGDWKEIGAGLMDFWTNSIREPDDVATRRGIIGSVLHTLMNSFNGLSDTSPINKKVDEILNMDAMRMAPVKLKVGSVDFVTGNLVYREVKDNDFMGYLKGSYAIPVAMPPAVSIPGKVLFDGGVREVAPLGTAINEGAGNIIGILCQPPNLNSTKNTFTGENLMELVERLQEIIVNQNVKNDSEWITYINRVISEARDYDLPSLKDYKIIKHLIIQPEEPLNIDISNFTSGDIVENMMLGYEVGKKTFQTKPVPWLV